MIHLHLMDQQQKFSMYVNDPLVLLQVTDFLQLSFQHSYHILLVLILKFPKINKKEGKIKYCTWFSVDTPFTY